MEVEVVTIGIVIWTTSGCWWPVSRSAHWATLGSSPVHFWPGSLQAAGDQQLAKSKYQLTINNLLTKQCIAYRQPILAISSWGDGIFCVVLQSFSNHYAATDKSIFYQHQAPCFGDSFTHSLASTSQSSAANSDNLSYVSYMEYVQYIITILQLSKQ